jgi:hypothetical protein
VQFFRAAGVDSKLWESWQANLRINRNAHSKFEIVRDILTRLNEMESDSALRQRREILKRVVEWENFATPWPDDQLKAKGLVADVRKTVDAKDSFTRMKQERENERQQRKEALDNQRKVEQKKREEREAIRRELRALFLQEDHRKRGKSFELVLSRLFSSYGLLVREPFTICGSEGEGIITQIDGVVEIDGHLYRVEVKWMTENVGVVDIAQHVTRVLYRGGRVRGMFISASEYTPAALHSLRQALQHQLHFACLLRELVLALEEDSDIREILREKIRLAAIDQNPLHMVGIL